MVAGAFVESNILGFLKHIVYHQLSGFDAWVCILHVLLMQASYYEEEVLPLLKEHKVLYFTHADSRLANNGLPDLVQRLRCRVNYQSLRFVPTIEKLGNSFIEKIHRGNMPYIALHLR